MTDKEFSSKAEKYIYSRDHFRKVAQHEFLKFNKDANLLVASINELVASLTLSISGKSFREIENGLYLADLMASFCRSHFIASDLLLGGELVEGAVIVRKQIELLARLNEITNGIDVDRLIRRTPNIKHLKSGLNRLYSDYSEISHSASPKAMELLGRKEYEQGTFTPLYPEFQENSYVSMQHLVMCALEYYVWAVNFFKDNFEAYDNAVDLLLFEKAFEQHEKIYTD
ncbi:hypothetical protein [Alteromonas sp. CyTr2]|uniref:hypothetical protein n=1 Tax=Alteromonas sp. CyTr2 TaxID=2935039 RepID=UPI00248D940C|nr:hypothetical protein [Alteromonas sp. CyTr2]